MKRKVYRFVSEVNITDEGEIKFEQKVSLLYFLMFGFISYLFKKSNKTICKKSKVKSITTQSSFMTGKLITITANDTQHVLEMRSQEALEESLSKLNYTPSK